MACENAFRLLLTRSHFDYIKFQHFCGLMDYLKTNTSLLERYLMYKALIKEDFQFDGTNSNTHDTPLSHSQQFLTLNKFYNIYEVMNLKWRNNIIPSPWFEKVPCFAIFRTLLNKIYFLVTHRFVWIFVLFNYNSLLIT